MKNATLIQSDLQPHLFISVFVLKPGVNGKHNHYRLKLRENLYLKFDTCTESPFWDVR